MNSYFAVAVAVDTRPLMRKALWRQSPEYEHTTHTVYIHDYGFTAVADTCQIESAVVHMYNMYMYMYMYM